MWGNLTTKTFFQPITSVLAIIDSPSFSLMISINSESQQITAKYIQYDDLSFFNRQVIPYVQAIYRLWLFQELTWRNMVIMSSLQPYQNCPQFQVTGSKTSAFNSAFLSQFYRDIVQSLLNSIDFSASKTYILSIQVFN